MDETGSEVHTHRQECRAPAGRRRAKWRQARRLPLHGGLIRGGSVASESSFDLFYPYTIGATVLASVVFGYINSRQTSKSDEKLNTAVEEIKKNSEDFGNLLDFNRTLIDKYHQGTRQRATLSFFAGMVAMAVGLGVVVYGAIAVFKTGEAGSTLNTQQRIVAATFSTVTGGIAAFIAQTFIQAHRDALADLSSYFHQPLVTSYLLSAERIADVIGTAGRNATKQRELERVLDATLLIATQEMQRAGAAKKQKSLTLTRLHKSRRLDRRPKPDSRDHGIRAASERQAPRPGGGAPKTARGNGKGDATGEERVARTRSGTPNATDRQRREDLPNRVGHTRQGG
jgi:hypothetical protein